MKKFFTCIIFGFMLCFFVIAVAACGKTTPVLEDYVVESGGKKIDSTETADGIIINGVLDDDGFYEGLNWFESSASDGSDSNNTMFAGMFEPCNLKVTSRFTDAGAYFAAEVFDKTIRTNADNMYLKPTQKTGITLYLAPFGSSSIAGQGYELILAADGSAMFRKHFLGEYKLFPLVGADFAVNIVGTPDENGNYSNAENYTMEAFVPWTAIGIDKKPEFIYCMVALIRNSSASSVDSAYIWESVTDGMNFNNPQTWLLFSDKGLFKAPQPLHGVLDADDSDWDDYTGRIIRTELGGIGTSDALDPRYFEYKMIKREDGFYVYAEGINRLYLNDPEAPGWSNVTNIEIIFLTEDGKQSNSFYVNAVGKTAGNTYGIMKAEDVNKNGKAYKFIRAEYFIPKSIFKLNNINFDDEYLRAGLAWCNRDSTRGGKINDEYSEIDPEFSESVKVEIPSTSAVQPGLWWAFGCSPYTASSLSFVNCDGIGLETPAGGNNIGTIGIDGDLSDWNEYKGVTSRIVEYTTGSSKETLDAGEFNIDVKIEKAVTGLFLSAKAKHYTFVKNNCEPCYTLDGKLEGSVSAPYLNNTMLFLEFSASAPDNSSRLNGTNIAITPMGVNNGCGVVDFVWDTKKTDDGMYETIVEAFIDYRLFKGSMSVLSTTDGKLSNDYDLRVGISWRSQGEEQNFLYGDKNKPYYIYPIGVKAWKDSTNYYINDNGLSSIPDATVSDKYIVDGKLGDWVGSENKIEWSFNSESYPAETRKLDIYAALESDGIYFALNFKAKSYIEIMRRNDITNNNPWWWRGLCAEIRIVKGNGKSDRLAALTSFGLFTANTLAATDFDGASPKVNVGNGISAFSAELGDDGFYDIVMEGFVTRSFAEKIYGKDFGDSMRISFVLSVDHLREKVTDGPDKTNKHQWCKGSPFQGTVAQDNEAFYWVSSDGLTAELNSPQI